MPASGERRCPAAKGATGTWWLAGGAYLLLAVRRVYEDRWWKASLEIVGLGFLYMLLVALVVGGVAFLSVLIV